ncbi:hypothetical protein ACUUL3_13260 [Thiovibrio sp. JS02]
MKKKLLAAFCLLATTGMASVAFAADYKDITTLTSEFNFAPSNDVSMNYWAGNAGAFTTGTTVQQYLLASKHKAGNQYYFSNQNSNILQSQKSDDLKGLTITDAMVKEGTDEDGAALVTLAPDADDLGLNTSTLIDAHAGLSKL